MRHLRHAARACAGALFALALSPRAEADCVAVTGACINSDTLWPHAGPGEFLTVGGTETVQASRIAFGLVATYLSRPIVLDLPAPDPTKPSPRNAIDNEINATFLFAYGVTDRLELDLALPVTIFQDGDGTSPLTGGAQIPTTATRDLRFGATYTFLKRPKKHPWRHDASGFGLAARFEITAPTGDENAFAGESNAVYVPSLTLDYRRHRFSSRRSSARAFVRRRISRARASERKQLSVAASAVDLLEHHDWLSVTAEARILPGFTEQGTLSQTVSGLQSVSNGTFIAPAEWMVTARTSPLEGGDLSIQLGVGGAIPTSIDPTTNAFGAPATVPRFRVALGLTFAPRGRDTDGDGIPDALDRCPLEPGPKSSEDGTGCPVKPQPQAP